MVVEGITRRVLAPRFMHKFLCLLVALLCLLIILTFPNKNEIDVFTPENYDLDQEKKYTDEFDFGNYSGIYTTGCRMPFIGVVEKSITDMISLDYLNEMESCKGNPLVESNKTHIWIQMHNVIYYKIENLYNLKCCYLAFYRPETVDDITAANSEEKVKYKRCKYFNNTIKASDEFVRVLCSETEILYDAFFVFAFEKVTNMTAHAIKFGTVLPYNILILGVDSVSRLNFHRAMPDTAAQLKRLDAVELFGYNIIGKNAFSNLIAVLLGRKVAELSQTCLPTSGAKFDNCPFVWKRFESAGFSTALAEDSSSMSIFNFENRSFLEYPTDYYFRSFIHEVERSVQSSNDSHPVLCVNEKLIFNIFLDYMGDLTTELKNKLFGLFWETTMTHYPGVMDEKYSELFSKMHDSGYLNKTIIFFMSDHGLRSDELRKTKQGFLEERLPFLFALFPKSFKKNYSLAYKNFKMNSRRLATPFDLHSTLVDLVNLKDLENDVIKSRSQENYLQARNVSLFLPVPGNRTCKLADIDDNWCACNKIVQASRNSSEALEAAEFVVSSVNDLLKDYPQCEELRLEEVMNVKELLLSGGQELGAEVWQELSVVVRTEPGGGLFEGTVRRAGIAGGAGAGGWVIAGDVIRLDFNNTKRACVEQHQLQNYCYCN